LLLVVAVVATQEEAGAVLADTLLDL